MPTTRFVLPTGEVVTLTPRRLDYLRRLAAGDSNEELAHALGITPKSAKNSVARVLDALNVRNRTEAVAVAMWANILIPPLPARTPDRLTRIERQRITRQNRAS